MPQYALGIIVPKEIFESGTTDIIQYISNKMFKYDVSLKVSNYIRYDLNEKDTYLQNQINKYEEILKNPELSKFFNIKYIQKKYKEYSNMTSNEYWDKHIIPYYNSENIDESGNIVCNDNPDGKWKKFKIGGIWSGRFTENFNIHENNSYDEDINMNSQILREYIEKCNINIDKYKMYAYLDKNDIWLERGNTDWFDNITHENYIFDDNLIDFLKTQDENDYIINLDCYI